MHRRHGLTVSNVCVYPSIYVCVCSRIGTRLISLSTHRPLLVRRLDLEFQKPCYGSSRKRSFIMQDVVRHRQKTQRIFYPVPWLSHHLCNTLSHVRGKKLTCATSRHMLLGQLIHTHKHIRLTGAGYQNRCVVRCKTFQLSNMQRVSGSVHRDGSEDGSEDGSNNGSDTDTDTDNGQRQQSKAKQRKAK